MASPSQGKERTTSYLLRLTPSEKSRWQKMASFYALPLAEFIRRRVESRPVTPPKVPAINAKTSVRMGQVDLQLRRLKDDFHWGIKEALAALTQQQPMPTTRYKELLKAINNVRELLVEVREELRDVRLQLSAVDESSESSEFDSGDDNSEFEAEDWE
ncbi:MAG TPA: hypothetical protein V6D12_09735 [Candidatus Obscuribacterales bacterium]